MNRCEALQDLSREHHQALVVAARLGRLEAGDELAMSEYWETLREVFFPSLEAHFAEEERGLLPLLQDEPALAERLQSDHRQLRRLMQADGFGERRAFGRCLKEHVRFEEKVLFAWLQANFDDRALDSARR